VTTLLSSGLTRPAACRESGKQGPARGGGRQGSLGGFAQWDYLMFEAQWMFRTWHKNVSGRRKLPSIFANNVAAASPRKLRLSTPVELNLRMTQADQPCGVPAGLGAPPVVTVSRSLCAVRECLLCKTHHVSLRVQLHTVCVFPLRLHSVQPRPFPTDVASLALACDQEATSYRYARCCV
jgi:hypothetical protein